MMLGGDAPGLVDERSIEEVQPQDLAEFAQCHFFAGIGGWSLALRTAGWPDDSAVWTGSCPCQSFSASGKRAGFGDKRHLWPAWFRLIRECRPDTIFGEQVASNDGLAWLDIVSADLEGAGYAVGAADLCAAGVGAPHIRQRLYFVADALQNRTRRIGREMGKAPRNTEGQELQVGRFTFETERGGQAGELADAERRRCEQRDAAERRVQEPDAGRAAGGVGESSIAGLEGHAGHGGEGDESRRDGEDAPRPASAPSTVGKLGHATNAGRETWDGNGLRIERCSGAITESSACASGGFWADVAWLPCRDGKLRPTQPGIFPLASGVPNRVGTLRGAGNAIVPQVAAAFIEAWREAKGTQRGLGL